MIQNKYLYNPWANVRNSQPLSCFGATFWPSEIWTRPSLCCRVKFDTIDHRDVILEVVWAQILPGPKRPWFPFYLCSVWDFDLALELPCCQSGMTRIQSFQKGTILIIYKQGQSSYFGLPRGLLIDTSRGLFHDVIAYCWGSVILLQSCYGGWCCDDPLLCFDSCAKNPWLKWKKGLPPTEPNLFGKLSRNFECELVKRVVKWWFS